MGPSPWYWVVAQWIAWWLPRRVVYFAILRAWSYATDGGPEDIPVGDVAHRWDQGTRPSRREEPKP